MKLGGQLFTGADTQRLLEEAAGIATRLAAKAFGFELGLAIGRDNDFDDPCYERRSDSAALGG
jgi:hypothetical protein